MTARSFSGDRYTSITRSSGWISTVQSARVVLAPPAMPTGRSGAGRAKLAAMPDNDAEPRRPPMPPLSQARAESTEAIVLTMLCALDRFVGPNTGNRLSHSLRTATVAERSGASAELIVAALCHDIGSAGRGQGHGRVAAEILRPYVAPRVAWAVSVHDDFVALHSARGWRRMRRYRHRLRPHYGLARRFAEWDVATWQQRPALPLEHFLPALRSVLATPVRASNWRRRLRRTVRRSLPTRVARRLSTTKPTPSRFEIVRAEPGIEPRSPDAELAAILAEQMLLDGSPHEDVEARVRKFAEGEG